MNNVEIFIVIFYTNSDVSYKILCFEEKRKTRCIIWRDFPQTQKNMFVAGRQGRPKKIRYNQTKSLYVILSEVEVLLRE